MSYHRGEPQFKTVAIPDTKRDDIVERVKNACLNEGKQAYCVYVDWWIGSIGSSLQRGYSRRAATQTART